MSALRNPTLARMAELFGPAGECWVRAATISTEEGREVHPGHPEARYYDLFGAYCHATAGRPQPAVLGALNDASPRGPTGGLFAGNDTAENFDVILAWLRRADSLLEGDHVEQ